MTRQEFELIARLLKSKEPVITAVGLALFEFSKHPSARGPCRTAKPPRRGEGVNPPECSGAVGSLSRARCVRLLLTLNARPDKHFGCL